MNMDVHIYIYIVFDKCFFDVQTDAYQATGCYNLLCSGFIQTNNRIAIGAAIQPTSTYDGGQFDISILVWKVISINYYYSIPYN